MELRFSFQRPCGLRNRASYRIRVASRGEHFFRASGLQTVRWSGSASRRESNRFSAGAEDAIRSFSSCNPFLRREELFLEGERDSHDSWRRPAAFSGMLPGQSMPCRCDLRRSPMPGRILRVRPLLLPPSEGTRILPSRFAASRNFLVFFIPESVVEPSRAATRHAAFCATLRGFTCCFPRAPQCLSAPRRALTTMGLNAVNRDPSISSSYHRSAPAAGWRVSGSTRGDHK